MDAVRIEAPHRHDLLDLGDAGLAAGRRRQVEIARGLAEHEVAALVGLPALDHAQVGADPALEDILLTVKVLDLFPFGDLGPDAGLGVETRDAGASRAHPFGKRALRTE